MITKIKRVAQFLFDNAELVAKFLCQSDNYRSVEIDLRVFKHKSPELEIMLTLYDEIVGLHDMKNDAIYKKRFVQLCNIINEDLGVIKLPEPVEVRNRLEWLEYKNQSSMINMGLQLNFAEYEKKVIAELFRNQSYMLKYLPIDWYIDKIKKITILNTQQISD